MMPNQVVEGDRFKAGFSIMNRTYNARGYLFSKPSTWAAGPGFRYLY